MNRVTTDLTYELGEDYDNQIQPSFGWIRGTVMNSDDELANELEEEFELRLDLQTLRQLSHSRSEHLLSELAGQQSYIPRHQQQPKKSLLSLSELYKKAQQQNLLSPQPNYA